MRQLAADHDLTHLTGALGVIPDERRGLAVDGGAHTGVWTHALAQNFASVVAFEPYGPYADKIPALANVDVYRLALGQNLGRAAMEHGDENAGQTHLSPAPDSGNVWIVPLDAFELADVDFIKLDVEGFEYPALMGARHTIARCEPWVMIEVNDLAEDLYGQDPQAAHKRLRQWGYRRVAIWNKDALYAP